MPHANAAIRAALFLAPFLAGCVTVTAENADDPYEGFNRQMYAFNDGLDRAVLEPVAKGYRAVTNEPVREGVTNFVNNLGEPVTFANELLQGKVPNAAGTVSRFVINTTIGLAGLFDTASAFGIRRTDEDFGQTLGVWGVDGGPYLVLPFLGSSNPRDLTGRGIDVALNPFSYAEFEGDDTLRISRTVLGALSGRERAIETIDNVRSTQLDPYTTVRRFYVRNRAAVIGNSEPMTEKVEDVPDYELEF
ncbi:MAG: VacJ family lipoprotein [Alphaproteobacteria bacterium]|nr:VacJ family lipoprotein [Alphaproteobacteria bacterium]